MFGDSHLVTRVGELLGPAHPVFAAATVTAAGSTIAGQGASADDDFEIASISKGITGLLYADAVDRAEVRRDSTLGELLPLTGSPIFAVTLDSLSTHCSGLPRLPKSAHPLRRAIMLAWRGTNPYGETLEQLVAQARGVRLGAPRSTYSNLGFELLGHAVASAVGLPFAGLVQDRLANALGLNGFYVPAKPGQLRPNAVIGASSGGKRRDPWTGEGLGPAGGVRATIGDMARLVAALLEGRAPGVSALDPVAEFDAASRIGAGWFTTEVDGRQITWHNGGSGGFCSWLGLDREAGTGVVILSARYGSVDRPGFALLTEVTNHSA